MKLGQLAQSKVFCLDGAGMRPNLQSARHTSMLDMDGSLETIRHRNHLVRICCTMKPLHKVEALLPFCILFADLEPANSAGLPCEELGLMIAQAGQKVVQQEKISGSWIANQLSKAERCSSAQEPSGKRVSYCYWSFPYRTGEARQLFSKLGQMMKNCASDQEQNSTDQPVNHPDSFEQQTFNLNQTEFSLSLKDKGALESTLVFIRVLNPIPDDS